MPSDPSPAFDPAEFTPERTLARVSEVRAHLRDDLLPVAAKRRDATFIVAFLEYLDTQAARFEEWVNAPLDLLALVVRNLLEYSIILPVVFLSEESRRFFLNEAFLDIQDLRKKLSRMFDEIGATPPRTAEGGVPGWPFTAERLTGGRDVFDDWMHKFCSKMAHPTAARVLCPESLMDPPKRLTFCFAGLSYLTRCYNLLSDEVFSPPHSTEQVAQS